MIVRVKEPITLVGGAEFADTTFERARALAPLLVAADSGADRVLSLGDMPEAVIGDFDSISADTRARIPAAAQHVIAEQESHDFDKCLRNIDSPLIIGVGFSGARLDHQLAACNTLVRHPGRRCVLVGEDDLVFLVPPILRLPLPEGCLVSLFPMGAVEGVSDGLHWPIGGINFAPDRQVGTSNRALGRIMVSVTAPKMLMMLPPQHLDIVATALLESRVSWPDA